jgi:hypothetical protein
MVELHIVPIIHSDGGRRLADSVIPVARKQKTAMIELRSTQTVHNQVQRAVE